MASYLDTYRQNRAKVRQEFDSGDRNLGEYILGRSYYSLAEPVERLFEAVTPDLGVGQFIGEQLERTGIPQYVRENTTEDTRRALGEGFGMLGITPLGRVIPSKAIRGIDLSSGDVFKRGHYNPTQVEVGMFQRDPLTGQQDRGLPRSSADNLGMLSSISRPVEQFALNVLNPAEQTLNKYKTAKGHAKFFLSGAGGMLQNLFSPEARALYTDYGISRSMDRAYGRYQKAVESNDPNAARQALVEAHQQAQQTGIIRKQTGAQAKKKDLTKSFLEASSDPNSPAPPVFKVSDYGDNWYEQTGAPAATFTDFPQEKSRFIQDHIERVWGGLKGYDRNTTNATIKTPRSDITGNHFTDVLAENPSVRTKIANLFLGGTKDSPQLRQFDSVDQLEEALKPLTQDNKYLKARGSNKVGDVKKDKFGKNELPSITLKGRDSDGVWVTIPGLVGKSGKVEGGINGLVHIKTNGDLIGVMSDMHNFLEEIPIPKVGRIRNRPMEVAVPEDYLNVTPPMQTNVVSISKEGKFGDAAEELREAPAQTIPVPPRAQSNVTNPAAKQRVEETMSQSASPASRARETGAVAGNIAALGMPLEYSDPFQEPDFR